MATCVPDKYNCEYCAQGHYESIQDSCNDACYEDCMVNGASVQAICTQQCCGSSQTWVCDNCKSACSSSQTCCGGKCANLMTDRNNCGMCGNSVGSCHFCEGGTSKSCEGTKESCGCAESSSSQCKKCKDYKLERDTSVATKHKCFADNSYCERYNFYKYLVFDSCSNYECKYKQGNGNDYTPTNSAIGAYIEKTATGVWVCDSGVQKCSASSKCCGCTETALSQATTGCKGSNGPGLVMAGACMKCSGKNTCTPVCQGTDLSCGCEKCFNCETEGGTDPDQRGNGDYILKNYRKCIDSKTLCPAWVVQEHREYKCTNKEITSPTQCGVKKSAPTEKCSSATKSCENGCEQSGDNAQCKLPDNCKVVSQTGECGTAVGCATGYRKYTISCLENGETKETKQCREDGTCPKVDEAKCKGLCCPSGSQNTPTSTGGCEYGKICTLDTVCCYVDSGGRCPASCTNGCFCSASQSRVGAGVLCAKSSSSSANGCQEACAGKSSVCTESQPSGYTHNSAGDSYCTSKYGSSRRCFCAGSSSADCSKYTNNCIDNVAKNNAHACGSSSNGCCYDSIPCGTKTCVVENGVAKCKSSSSDPSSQKPSCTRAIGGACAGYDTVSGCSSRPSSSGFSTTFVWEPVSSSCSGSTPYCYCGTKKSSSDGAGSDEIGCNAVCSPKAGSSRCYCKCQTAGYYLDKGYTCSASGPDYTCWQVCGGDGECLSSPTEEYNTPNIAGDAHCKPLNGKCYCRTPSPSDACSTNLECDCTNQKLCLNGQWSSGDKYVSYCEGTGKCSSSTCTDSDGGPNYGTYGECTSGGYTYKDSCKDASTLYERFCSSGKCGTITYTCPSGKCQDGKCVESSDSSSSTTTKTGFWCISGSTTKYCTKVNVNSDGSLGSCVSGYSLTCPTGQTCSSTEKKCILSSSATCNSERFPNQCSPDKKIAYNNAHICTTNSGACCFDSTKCDNVQTCVVENGVAKCVAEDAPQENVPEGGGDVVPEDEQESCPGECFKKSSTLTAKEVCGNFKRSYVGSGSAYGCKETNRPLCCGEIGSGSNPDIPSECEENSECKSSLEARGCKGSGLCPLCLNGKCSCGVGSVCSTHGDDSEDSEDSDSKDTPEGDSEDAPKEDAPREGPGSEESPNGETVPEQPEEQPDCNINPGEKCPTECESCVCKDGENPDVAQGEVCLERSAQEGSPGGGSGEAAEEWSDQAAAPKGCTWENVGCGAGTCGDTYMRKVRNCGAGNEYKCFADESCTSSSSRELCLSDYVDSIEDYAWKWGIKGKTYQNYQTYVAESQSDHSHAAEIELHCSEYEKWFNVPEAGVPGWDCITVGCEPVYSSYAVPDSTYSIGDGGCKRGLFIAIDKDATALPQRVIIENIYPGYVKVLSFAGSGSVKLIHACFDPVNVEKGILRVG